jgi:hypothetical protein
MSRNIALYVKDILQSMRDTQEFVQGLLYEDFAGDKKTFNMFFPLTIDDSPCTDFCSFVSPRHERNRKEMA